MTDKIAEFIAEAETLAEKVEQSFGNLNGAQLNWKPGAKNWSAGRCLEHLIVTNELYFPNIQKVLDGEHRNNFFSKIPFAVDLIAALMRSGLKPEQARKMKTFKIFEPAASDISETIVEDFAANQSKMIAMMKAAESFDVRKIKIAEPLSLALNLRLIDAFEILILHRKASFSASRKSFAKRKFSEIKMSVYVIAQVSITDRAVYDRYQSRFSDVFRKFKGELPAAAGEAPEVIEGEWTREKIVLMKFPDKKSFEDWANSAEYREIVKDRCAGSDAVVL